MIYVHVKWKECIVMCDGLKYEMFMFMLTWTCTFPVLCNMGIGAEIELCNYVITKQ